jgi:hypothetical protein
MPVKPVKSWNKLAQGKSPSRSVFRTEEIYSAEEQEPPEIQQIVSQKVHLGEILYLVEWVSEFAECGKDVID